MQVKLTEPGRLRVALSGEDLLRLHISYDQLDYRNLKSKQLLWRLLRDAGPITGFTPQPGGRLLIEVYPDGSGCVIYFTTIQAVEESRGRTSGGAGGEVRRQPPGLEALFQEENVVSKAKPRLRRLKCEPFVFEFSDAEDLLSAIDRLRGDTELRNSALYRQGERYRLILRYPAEGGGFLDDMYEYGICRGAGRLAAAFTEEHWETLLKEDAVKKFGAFM